MKIRTGNSLGHISISCGSYVEFSSIDIVRQKLDSGRPYKSIMVGQTSITFWGDFDESKV